MRRLLAILVVAAGLGDPGLGRHGGVRPAGAGAALRRLHRHGGAVRPRRGRGLRRRDRPADDSWSVLVLERWVPLAPEAQIAAYRTALGELGSRDRTYALIVRHADWCLREFTPPL